MIRLTNILLLCKLAGVVAAMSCFGCEPPKPIPPQAAPTDPKLAQALSDISQTLQRLDREPVAPVIHLDRLEQGMEKLAAKFEARAVKQQSTSSQSATKSTAKAYGGWTGCLVHLGPNCPPCVNYKGIRDDHIQRHLADEKHWTFGTGEQFHFNELHHATLDEEMPKFEFIRDGTVFHTHIGFNGQADFLKLLDLHPNCDWNAKRQQARAAKYNSVERSSGTSSTYRGNGSTGGYANSYGTRARVAGYRADGSLQLEADDNATWGEMKAAVQEENHQQEWFEYRQNRAMNRQYQVYRQQTSWPVYGTYGTYGTYRGSNCYGGVCYPW